MISLRRVFTAARCRVARAVLHGLRWKFGFDAWHVNAPYWCRPYKRAVVELASSVAPRTVVEVGCGLGDILTRVRAAERIGLDIDAKVIEAARFLHRGKARWLVGDGSLVGAAVGADREIDCLIMVNWIHNLAASDIAALLLPLMPRLRYLVLDAIDPDATQSYRYRHDFSFLAGLTRRVSAVRVAHEPRSFLLLQVVK